MICIKCKRDVPDAPYCCQCGAKQERGKPAARKRGNGTGTAIKRGKTWTVIVPSVSYTEEQPDGSLRLVRRRKSKGGFPTKTAALAYAPVLMSGGARTTPTLAELWNGWSRNDMLKLSDSKQTAYNIAWKRLKPIEARHIDSLTVDDLQDVVNKNGGTHYKARDMKSVLSKLYQRAMANRFVEVNLSKFVVLPDLDEKEAEHFDEAEVSKMWGAFEGGNVFVGYILLLCYTGMMPAELKACRKDMIDRDKSEIWGCGKKTKKRKKELPIVYPSFLAPVLDALCAYSESDMLLNLGHNQFYDKYHATLQEIGVRDLPPYSCRHTYGTEAVKGRNSPEVVRQMLRHSTILMQQRYAHLSSDAAHAAADAMKH